MKQPDANHFIKAMEEEIRAHEDNDHWEIVSREDIPINTSVLPAIWSMRRKRRIDTREFYKWKARYGGLDVSEARRLKALEDENGRLKRMLADAMLDNAALKDLLGKKW